MQQGHASSHGTAGPERVAPAPPAAPAVVRNTTFLSCPQRVPWWPHHTVALLRGDRRCQWPWELQASMCTSRRRVQEKTSLPSPDCKPFSLVQIGWQPLGARHVPTELAQLRAVVEPGDRENGQNWVPMRKEEVNRCWMSNRHIHVPVRLYPPAAHWIPTQPRGQWDSFHL